MREPNEDDDWQIDPYHPDMVRPFNMLIGGLIVCAAVAVFGIVMIFATNIH